MAEVLVDDRAVMARLGPIYRECLAQLWDTVYRARVDAASADPGDPESAQFERVRRSAQHLADNFEHYPLLLIAFVRGDNSGGSIFPAVWSFMLAARSRGLGTVLTTVHVEHEAEMAELLGIPREAVTQVALVPVAHAVGDHFERATRRPVGEVVHRERW